MMQALVTSLYHCQSSLIKQVKNIPGTDCLCIEFVFDTEAPGPVLFHQVTTNFTSIVISWKAPSDDNGVIVDYEIQINYDLTTTTINRAKEMYILPDLSPDTRVEFSVSAVSVCGAVGVVSATTEYTKAVRKSSYTIIQKHTILFSNC